jgi:translation initiation factor 2 subunit 1
VRGRDELSRPEDWPEVGDLIVGTVSRVTPYGAYVTLDEYRGLEGLMHVSEIASSWVKNIRDFVREGQKVVLKVLKTDPEKGHVDLSMRRVTERERREKMLEWKRDKRAEALLRMATEKVGKKEEADTIVAPKLLRQFGKLYDAFEEGAIKGESVYEKAGLSEEWAKALSEIAKAKIKVRRVRIRGVLQLSCHGGDGVDLIKKALTRARNAPKARDARVDLRVLGAPRYRIEVMARNYKDAEKALKAAVDEAISIMEAGQGQASFQREEV